MDEATLATFKSALLKGAQTFAQNAAKGALGQVVSNNFEKCRTKGCTAHSLGMVCSACSDFSCQDHILFTASIPPKPICVFCVYTEHREYRKAAKARGVAL